MEGLKIKIVKGRNVKVAYLVKVKTVMLLSLVILNGFLLIGIE